MPITDTYISVCQGSILFRTQPWTVDRDVTSCRVPVGHEGTDWSAAKEALVKAGVAHYLIVDREVVTDPDGAGSAEPLGNSGFGGFVAWWPDAAAFDAFVNANRSLGGDICLLRCFNIVQPITDGTLEESGKDISNAKVCGQLYVACCVYKPCIAGTAHNSAENDRRSCSSMESSTTKLTTLTCGLESPPQSKLHRSPR